MKKNTLILGLIGLFVISSAFKTNNASSKPINNIIFVSEFNAGWEDGYCEGWKDVKGELSICPITPLPPIPPIGKDHYRGGYNMGFKAGMRAAYKD